MAYTTPRTWVAGERPTAAQFNQEIRDNIAALANPPSCRVYRGADQSIPATTVTTILWTLEEWDSTAGMHSTSVNTSRIVAPISGVYTVTFQAVFQGNATGRRSILLLANGTTYFGKDERPPVTAGGPDHTAMSITMDWKLTAGQYVEAQVAQTSGGALNFLSGAGREFGSFSIRWAGLG